MFELDVHTQHIKECAAYGGFDCDCQERVEYAIIGWARQYATEVETPELQALFALLDESPWR